MAYRVNEYNNTKIKQIRLDSDYIRWCRWNENGMLLMPIIAKGNIYQGIEAK